MVQGRRGLFIYSLVSLYAAVIKITNKNKLINLKNISNMILYKNIWKGNMKTDEPARTEFLWLRTDR